MYGGRILNVPCEFNLIYCHTINYLYQNEDNLGAIISHIIYIYRLGHQRYIAFNKM